MPFKSVLLLVAISLADSVAWADPAVPQELADRLSRIVRKHYPDAQISRDNGMFLAKRDTMIFTIHRRLKTGEYLEKTDRIEGPNAEGFLLGLAVKDGKYEGPALLPSGGQDPYWQAYYDCPPTADGKSHLVIHFKCGVKVLGTEFRKEVFQALPRSGPPAKKQ